MINSKVRAAIVDYVQTKQEWQSLPEPSRTGQQQDRPSESMEVSALTWPKGVGKGKTGKGRGKGKSKSAKGKPRKPGKDGLLRGGSWMALGACIKCGQFGHFAADCEEYSDEEDMWSVRCWYCWGWGHRARNCPSCSGVEDISALVETDSPDDPGRSLDDSQADHMERVLSSLQEDASRQYSLADLLRGAEEELDKEATVGHDGDHVRPRWKHIALGRRVDQA